VGDIQTHATIGRHITDRLRAARADEKYIYFEIGNWLTDMSQFRDPTAFIQAKAKVWDAAGEASAAARIPLARDVFARLDNYLDELFGRPGENGGKMGEYWRHIVFALTLEIFRRSDNTLDPAQLEEIYDKHFTQYFPHEHLDFPPPERGIVGPHTPSEIARHRCGAAPGPEKRKTLTYLEEQLVFVANLLTLIEKDWAQARADAATTMRRHSVLARFGHASHAVEDFFFHSNFIELGWQLRSLALPPPPTPPEDTNPADFSAARMDRLYHRRRRKPVADGDDVSSTTSEEATHVYTGYFGGDDVSHTLTDALEGLMRLRKRMLGADAASAFTSIGHIGNILGDIEKAFETDEAKQEENLRKHRERLDNGDAYKDLEAALHAAPPDDIHKRTYDHLKAAYDLDKKMGEDYSLARGSKPRLGIYGMIQLLGAMSSKEHERSFVASREFDGVASGDSRYEGIRNATKNGASAEQIGSHSLMAKDSERKEPLRPHSVRVATRAAVFVGEKMAERIAAAPADGAPTEGLDWQHVLRHFIAHPSESEGASSGEPWWQSIALDDALVTTGDVFYTAPAPIAAAEMNRRAGEPNKKELEKLYTDLEKTFERAWRSKINWRFVGDATFWSFVFGLLGGLIGGLVGCASTDRELTAGDWAAATFGGMGIGIAGGTLLTFALTALGTLAGDGATGSAVMAIIGIFVMALGGGFGAGFGLSRAVGKEPQP
jgi:hypothetical protein